MNEKLKTVLRSSYAMPFMIIGFFYRSYTTNRARVTALLAKPGFSTVVRGAMVLTVAVWIIIWLLASEESRDALTDVVKENFKTLNP